MIRLADMETNRLADGRTLGHMIRLADTETDALADRLTNTGTYVQTGRHGETRRPTNKQTDEH